METLLRFRGRDYKQPDVDFIRALIAAHPGVSRRRLSSELAAAWNLKQSNGAPRDMVCRSLMLALHRAGHLELPPVKFRPPNPLARRERPKMQGDLFDMPVATSLAGLGALEIRQVRRTGEERRFNALMQAHHYLGYMQPVGEHLKLMAYAGERPVALFAWSSAPRHLAPRDRYIGWTKEARKQNIRYVAYNSRYLILPWVAVPHLASHLLGRMARMLSGEWEKVYGHPVYFAETFVDPQRFKGTCYRAANWTYLGRTTGRGKDDIANRGPNRSLKVVLGYPLVEDFRRRLSVAA
jgi:hypothetical protein